MITQHSTFGSRLKSLRIRAVMSQYDLADASGLARPTITRLEADMQEPTPQTVRKLAKGLGVEPQVLMGDGEVLK